MEQECEGISGSYFAGHHHRTAFLIRILLLLTSTAETAPTYRGIVGTANWAAAAADVHVSSAPVSQDDPETSACPTHINQDSRLCIGVRGGFDASHSVSSAEAIISDFLTESNKDPQGRGKGEFHVQGWRWHTRSLVRDAGRLERLAIRLLSSPSSSSGVQEDDKTEGHLLEKAADHVVDFNMKGLHRVEDELFFPWLRDKLCADGDKGGEVASAFREVLNDIEEDRRKVANLGVAMREQAKIASDPSIPEPKRSEATVNVAQMSAALTSRAQDMMEKEEQFLVPAVASLVSEQEQKSFNNKVIRKLGVLDSRVHLVGMYDTVWEGDDESERDAFQRAIPVLPRMMIPRWRRNLYEPRAGVLDEVQ